MPMTDTPVTCLVASNDKLGEGCFWDAEGGFLWWLDIILPSRIHRLHIESGDHRSWALTEMVTAMAKRRDGTLIVGSANGLNFFNPRSGALTAINRQLEPERPQNRGNDGACDARGRFWFGTMMNNIGRDGSDMPITHSSGTLFRVDPDLAVTAMVHNVGVSNGPCWSPDGKTFYFTDSMAQVIWAYDFDVEAGTISNRRVFNDSKDHGYPDGATVDADGFVWSARWEGHCVVRIDPKGRIDRIVPMPASRVTNVCFGGANLDILYATTARAGVAEAVLHKNPLQGGLFCFDPGVRGFEKHPFGG
jgi:sugar lactone lactonase YvrE